MYMYTCIYVYIHMEIYINIYIYISIYVYICTYIEIRVCTHKYIQIRSGGCSLPATRVFGVMFVG